MKRSGRRSGKQQSKKQKKGLVTRPHWAVTGALVASTMMGGTRAVAQDSTRVARPAGTRDGGAGVGRGQVLPSTTVTGARQRVASPKHTGPLRDAPQTIAIVSAEVLQEQGTTSLRDALRNVPGITINAGEGGATPGDNFNVRGFSARTDLFVDGVRDVAGYTREAFNIEQVEVAKGPASAYAGRGSTGGSINVVTKTPRLSPSRELTLVAGSAEQKRVMADVNQPLGVAGGAFRLNAMWSDGGVAGNDVIETQSWGVAPAVSFGLGSRTPVTIAYTRTKQDNVPSYGVSSFDAVPSVDTRNFFGLRNLDFERVAANQLTARVEHDFGAVQIRNHTTRGHAEVDRIVTFANLANGQRRSVGHRTRDNVVANQTNLSARFGAAGIEHAVSAGVELTREHSNFGRYTVTGTLPDANLEDPSAEDRFTGTVTPTANPREVKANGIGVYAFETARLGRHWEVNAGLRWDRYSPKYMNSATQPAVSSAVSGRAGVVFKPVEAGSLYAAYGTSFNPSSEKLGYDAASDLAPEQGRSYEVGAKWELLKQRLLGTVALFRTDKTNARTPSLEDPTVTVLAGKQRVEGAELGGNGRLSERWSLLGAYTYLRSKYLTSGTAGQVGTEFVNTPKHTGSVWSTYRLPARIQVGAGARYVGKRLLRAPIWVPGYTAVDAMASYDATDRVALQLNLYNLTDETYYDNGRFWVPAPARSVRLATTLKF